MKHEDYSSSRYRSIMKSNPEARTVSGLPLLQRRRREQENHPLQDAVLPDGTDPEMAWRVSYCKGFFPKWDL